MLSLIYNSRFIHKTSIFSFSTYKTESSHVSGVACCDRVVRDPGLLSTFILQMGPCTIRNLTGGELS